MESVEEVRTSDLDTTYIEDTTAFFEDLKIVDDSCFVKNIDGEVIRLNNENPSEIIQTTFPSASSRKSEVAARNVYQAESDDEIEVPRGFLAEPASVHQEMNDEVSPQVEDEKQERGENDIKKVEQFLKNLVENPEWARSLPYVKLNATVPKNIQLKLITHAYINVNMRPKYMTILTKSVDAGDLAHFVKIAFDTADSPPERSLFRLYCRNPVPSFKALLRAMLLVSNEKDSIEIEYSEVLGELAHKGSKIRSKTEDVKAFCKVEELGRALGMRFLTTLVCRSLGNRNRLLNIRYYDELKATGVRVVYLHMDHEAFNNCGITFSDVNRSIPYEVETEQMTPLRCMYPPVHDLISLIRKLSPSH